MKREYNKLKEKKGITLIALIVTIVVLLIIAGITVATTVGGDGIVDRIRQAQEEFDEKKSEEQRKIDETRNKLNMVVANIDAGKTATEGNSRYTDGSGKKAIVPQGFTVSGKEGEDSIENGLVIYNTNGQEVTDWDAVDKTTYDQWVWIPVENVNDMYTYSEEGIALCGNTGVKTKYYSKTITLGDRTITRATPGYASGYREPDLVIGDGTQWDAQYYADAGFTSLSNMAYSLVNDYKEMLDSVKKFGGFYIGRYELTGSVDNPTEKSDRVLDTQNWYNSYKACKNLGLNNETVETRMVWGNQWDEICKFISTKGDKVDLDDSREYGNYNNSTGDAATYSGSSNWNGLTGRSEFWKVNNIYDLAGNCNEWTQEAGLGYFRFVNGGAWSNDSSVSIHGTGIKVTNAYGDLSTRPTMYLKPTESITAKKLGYVTDGLVAMYDGIENTRKGNDPSSTVWRDLSDNHNDAIGYNINTENGYYSLDDNGYIITNGSAYFQTEDNIGIYGDPLYTIEYVVKPYDLPNTGAFMGPLWWGAQSIGNGVFPVIETNWKLTNGWAFIYSMSDNTYQSTLQNKTVSISTSKIATGVLTLGDKNCVKTFINNTRIPVTQQGNESVQCNVNNSKMTIGNVGGASRYFNGVIKSIRIYNRVLTDSEIAKNYNVDNTRFNLD